MKRISRLISICLVALTILPLTVSGQARINTKRIRIADLTTHTVKVVLSGNDMTDSALKNEVSARWRISPYEFCDSEEYKSIKENTDYYFLLLARSNEKKYRGILTLTLMKGGKYGAEDPEKRPVEVASLPFCSSEFPSGREVAFLPALLDIIQDYASKAVISDRAGYRGFKIYAKNVSRTGNMRIFFCEDDIAPEIDVAFKDKYFDEDMLVEDESVVDAELAKGSYNTLVSYTVSPFDPQNGSYCYKMLIDAETHGLFYFKHHRISSGKWAGFLPKDIRTISVPR